MGDNLKKIKKEDDLNKGKEKKEDDLKKIKWKTTSKQNGRRTNQPKST